MQVLCYISKHLTGVDPLLLGFQNLMYSLLFVVDVITVYCVSVQNYWLYFKAFMYSRSPKSIQLECYIGLHTLQKHLSHTVNKPYMYLCIFIIQNGSMLYNVKRNKNKLKIQTSLDIMCSMRSSREVIQRSLSVEESGPTRDQGQLCP